MTEYRRNHGHDCEPTDNPAEQPKPPTDGAECKEPDPIQPPDLWKDPDSCWKPDPSCECPTKTEVSTECFEGLIKKQADEIVEAEKAAEFKKILEDLLEKAQTV